MKSRIIVFLIVLILIVDLTYFYPQISGFFSFSNCVRQEANVTRIIDGDTIEIQINEKNQKTRLLGVNSPEKNTLFYNEAKNFLEILENKTIKIEIREQDKYGRLLGYVFYQNKLINKGILEEGLGNLYYYEQDNYYKKLKSAENEAREKEKGIWKKSLYFGCLEIYEFNFQEPEKLVLKNNCNKDFNLIVKDDATHIFKETINKNSFLIKETSHIWNNDGDSIYVWDEKGLMLFYRYG